jgi:hypothetical protein
MTALIENSIQDRVVFNSPAVDAAWVVSSIPKLIPDGVSPEADFDFRSACARPYHYHDF